MTGGDDNVSKYHSCDYPLEWRGCYDKDSQYAKYVTPDSYSHPAKMSFGLLERIFKHLQELRLVDDNTTIVDFMAGTFRTGVMAELFGYRSIGIELEPHFIKMIEGNRAQIEKLTGRRTRMEFMQGDARSLSTMLREKGCVGVVSPPYSDQNNDNRKTFNDTISRNGRANIGHIYTINEDNIGNLKDAPLVGITSPPYSDALKEGRDTLSFKKQFSDGRRLEDLASSGQVHNYRYSTSQDNIGNLKDAPLVGITSPPYASVRELDPSTDEKEYETKDLQNPCGKGCFRGRYVDNPSNIGNLPDRQLVGITSPPYEEQNNRADHLKFNNNYNSKNCGMGRWHQADKDYGTNPDNLGNQNSATYLSAMLQVYSEAFRSGISPLVLVTKNPTRNGKLRRLDLDTISILQQSGYEIFDYHRAILFEEVTQATLGGEAFTKPKGRLSFFKRLSYEKGNIVARWEDIIFARIPNGRGELKVQR